MREAAMGFLNGLLYWRRLWYFVPRRGAVRVVWSIILIPIFGAVIGWGTNWLAIRMLFRPYKAWRVPLTRIVVQGAIPKRRHDIALAIGQVVSDELLSLDDLLTDLLNQETRTRLANQARDLVEKRVVERMPGFLPGPVRNLVLQYLDGVLAQEVPGAIDAMAVEALRIGKEKLDIKKTVVDKLDAFDLKQLEALVQRIAHQELFMIEILGGVLGFIIGLFQMLLALVV